MQSLLNLYRSAQIDGLVLMQVYSHDWRVDLLRNNGYPFVMIGHTDNNDGVSSSAYSGLPQAIKPNSLYQSQQRFGLYRWHIMDPIRFKHDLRVTIQALGWTSRRNYLPMQDDIASTVFWYQTEPHVPFAPLPHRNQIEVI